VQRVQALLERDQVDVVVGVIFSNVMMAIAKPVFDSETVLLSPNAGPSPLAGASCSPWFVSSAWQNDQNHEAMGKHAQDAGYKRVALIAPNYQAGRDSLAGFKRHYKGEIAEEIYSQVNQLDYSAEIARIAAARPDAVFAFLPGGKTFVMTYTEPYSEQTDWKDVRHVVFLDTGLHFPETLEVREVGQPLGAPPVNEPSGHTSAVASLAEH
jgi:ABC-type branched-subunit amino acid transport system substrate-binding protein